MNKVNSIPMLILDRYEGADSFVIAKLLEELLRHVPRLQVMIATRCRPRLSVGDLASRNQVAELEPEDLVFTPRETHAAFDDAMPEVYARRLHAKVSGRSEEHTSELQSLMRSSYAVFCLKKKKQ